MGRDRERRTETLEPLTFADQTESVFDPTTRRVSTRALRELIAGAGDDDAPTQIPAPEDPNRKRMLEELKARRSGEALAEPFGRYSLLGSVGKGGMAEVRLAARRDGDAVKLCVVKRTKPGRAQRAASAASGVGREGLARAGPEGDGADRLALALREEGRVMKMLVHPNIVRLLDDGERRGAPFLAFELIDGVSLREMIELVRPGRVPLNGVLEIGRACASALAHAHACGVVHRDVTPQNVLVARDGEVKLVDFGIARSEGREHETRQGHVKGKLGYMAPEQCRSGEPIDGKADVFTLGLVLTELIAGERVLPPTFILLAESEPLVRRRLEAARYRVPDAVPELLVRMTAMEARERPSAEEVERELGLALEGAAGETLPEFVARAVFAGLEPFETGVALDPPVEEMLEPTESDPFSYAMTVRRLRPYSGAGETRRLERPGPPVEKAEENEQPEKGRALFFFALVAAVLGFGALLYVLITRFG